MEEQERRRIEGLNVEEFDQELFSRFGLKPKLKVVPDNPHGYDIDPTSVPDGDTPERRFWGVWIYHDSGRGLEYCHYLHRLMRY